ncbi:proline racemase family protein [Pseudomonas aeruginosa]|uniref:proline racemase family protein n=1 Tax=Pseudomonas aeruginosa TaxID=287 RepID=UPI003DA6FC66
MHWSERPARLQVVEACAESSSRSGFLGISTRPRHHRPGRLAGTSGGSVPACTASRRRSARSRRPSTRTARSACATSPAYHYRRQVSVEVPGIGRVSGDIAWGGNWSSSPGHGQHASPATTSTPSPPTAAPAGAAQARASAARTAAPSIHRTSSPTIPRRRPPSAALSSRLRPARPAAPASTPATSEHAPPCPGRRRPRLASAAPGRPSRARQA